MPSKSAQKGSETPPGSQPVMRIGNYRCCEKLDAAGGFWAVPWCLDLPPPVMRLPGLPGGDREGFSLSHARMKQQKYHTLGDSKGVGGFFPGLPGGVDNPIVLALATF